MVRRRSITLSGLPEKAVVTSKTVELRAASVPTHLVQIGRHLHKAYHVSVENRIVEDTSHFTTFGYELFYKDPRTKLIALFPTEGAGGVSDAVVGSSVYVRALDRSWGACEITRKSLMGDRILVEFMSMEEV